MSFPAIPTEKQNPWFDTFVAWSGAVEAAVMAVTKPNTGAVRYVTLDGDDDNDGLSWADAKRTIASAVASLPTLGVGASLRRAGIIEVGGGTFVETATPIEYNGGLTIRGRGAGNDGNTFVGTAIKLGNGRNTALFEPSDSFTDYAHQMIMENLILDGNAVNNGSMTDPLVTIYRGGFGSYWQNVHTINTKTRPLRLAKNAVNFAMYSCTCATSDDGFVHLDLDTNGTVFTLIDTQIDNWNESAILVSIADAVDSTFTTIRLASVKSEQVSAGYAGHVVEVSPRPSAFGNPITIEIDGLVSNATNGESSALAALHESTGSGIAQHWILKNVLTQNYAKAFSNVNTGQESSSNEIIHGIFGPLVPSYAARPHLQVGGTLHWVGSGSPESVLSAPVGSTFLRTDGSTSTTLYIKTSGTGTTGWTAK